MAEILILLLGGYNITLNYNYVGQIEELLDVPVASVSFGFCFGRYEDRWGVFIENSYISAHSHTKDVSAEIGVNSLELSGFYQWNWKSLFLRAGAGLIRIDAAGRGRGIYGGGVFDIEEFGAQGMFQITFMPFKNLWLKTRIKGLPPVRFDATYWKLAGSITYTPFIEGQGILGRLSIRPGVSLLKIGGRREGIEILMSIWMGSIGIGYCF